MEEVQPKVKDRSRHGLPVNQDVRLVEVPSAGAANRERASVSRFYESAQGRGPTDRTMSVAVLSFSLYSFPLGAVKAMVRRTAS